MVALTLPGRRGSHFSPPTDRPRGYGAEQLTMMAGQLTAGAGNFAFAVIMARVLAPRAFAELTTFLALYLLVNLPAASIAASASLAPDRAGHSRRPVAVASTSAGVAIALASPGLSPLLHLPVVLVVVLGFATPSAGPLALARGRLYGRFRHRRLVASMVAEPAVRLALGVGLAAATGAVGGAVAVTLAGYGALEVARRIPRQSVSAELQMPVDTPGSDTGVGVAGWSAAAFLLLAVIQNQDLVFANRILSATGAASYGVLSTLGGVAAFATATVPLVLLPRAAAAFGRREATIVAIASAATLGTAAVIVALVVPGLLTSSLFGARYSSVEPHVALYLSAMALLGVGRVLVAQRCGTGAARSAVARVALVAAGQAGIIVLFGHSVAAIAATTLAATIALVLLFVPTALAGPPGTPARRRDGSPPDPLIVPAPTLRVPSVPAPTLTAPTVPALSVPAPGLAPTRRPTPAGWRRMLAKLRRPTTITVGVISLVGLAIRLVVPRGIWIDEATSIHDAALPFGQMLANLRNTDVHPPLYFAVLWVTVRATGTTAASVMRLPSILFGSLVPPAAYIAARDLWDRRTGIVAAGLCGLAPLLVWYSQETRMYSLFMLLAVLAVWAQVMAVRDGRRRYWAIFVVASAGLVWTEYFGLLQVLTQVGIFGVALLRARRTRDAFGSLARRAVLSLAAVGALCTPLIPYVMHQFQVNQATGKGFESAPSQVGVAGTQALSLYAILANAVWAVFGYHSTATMAALGAMWPLGMLGALFLLGRRRQPDTSIVLACILAPAAVITAVGIVKPDLFDIRYLSGGVVLTILLLARVVTATNHRAAMQIGACAGIAALLGVGLVDEQVNGANPRRYDFQSALATVNSRYRPGDSVLYSPTALALVVSYYSPHASASAVAAAPPVRSLASAGRDVFVVVTPALMHGDDRETVDAELARLRRQGLLIDHFSQANVTVWEFRDVYGPVVRG